MFYFSIQEQGMGLVMKKIFQEKVLDVRLLTDSDADELLWSKASHS